MPEINKGEDQTSFISRCIPIVMKEGTTTDSKQAAAICYSMWKQHEKKDDADFSEERPND